MGCTLVRPLVSLRLFPADVNDQSSWAGLRQDIGVFLHIKVGAVSRPGEAKIEQNSKNEPSFFQDSGNKETYKRD